MKGLLVNINSIKLTISLLTILDKEQQIDEYGFIIMSKEEKQERTRWFSRLSHYKGGATVGNACHCRGLCKYLPYKGKGGWVSFKKTGEYWCKVCERAIKCYRCRCCGNLGRKEPRSRNRDSEKRIE